MYSTVQRVLDQCVYFISVTTITTVQTGIKILIDSNSIWVKTKMHSSVNSKKTSGHFNPLR